MPSSDKIRQRELARPHPLLMRDPLTPLERDVYLYLVDFLAEHSYQPSVRDIASKFSIPSTKTVSQILRSLEDKGYVELGGGRSRGIRILGAAAPTGAIPVPLYSRLAASRPAIRDDNLTEYVILDRRLARDPEAFLIRGDFVTLPIQYAAAGGIALLVDPSAPASDGSLVLARVGSEGVVGTIEHRGPETVLLTGSANAEVVAVTLEGAADCEVIGVVLGALTPLGPSPWPLPSQPLS